MAKKIKANTRRLLAVVLVFTLLGSFFYWKSSQAAALTALSDTMTRLGDAEEANHDIRFRTPTGMSASTITINLGTSGGFTNSANGTVDYTDMDLQYGSSQSEVNGSCSSSCTQATLAGSAGAGTWGAALDGSVDLTLTYPSSGGTAIAANDYVRILIGTNASGGNAQLENAASTGTKTFTVNVAGTTDTGKIAVVIITDDQIPVTASVNPTISFTVVNTTLALGVLDSGGISTSSYNNLTVGTNGTGGYTISVKDAGNGSNPGLYNTPATKLIASADATPLTAGTEGYGGQCNKVSGSGSCNFTGTSDNVDGFTLAGETFASYGSKPSGTDTFQIRVKAAISTSTDAGAYADTLTLIATGNF